MSERRTLVLGGGGVTGIAWEIGMLAGLAEHGIELSGADVVIGTSAGSVVGAAIGSDVAVDELYRRQLGPATGERAARVSPSNLVGYIVAGVHPNRVAGRARLGHRATRARLGVTAEQRRSVIESRLPSTSWPTRFDLRVTAVDADTGALRVFDRSSGIELVDAVAASCAVPLVWPVVQIDGHRYIDGGMRSAANVDLADDADRVVVLAPMLAALRPADRPDRQLRALGPDVVGLVVSPSNEARTALGRNPLDPARRAPAAEAGRAQSALVVDDVARAWS